MAHPSGKFISIEGADGLGKSTQLQLLEQRFAHAKQAVIRTREPGGTSVAEAIRCLLTTGDPHRLHPTTELLLHTAARAEHVARLIRPALAEGTHVLCDRYVDSTLVYQGAGQAQPEEAILQLHHLATDNLFPDLTLVLVGPPALSATRLAARQMTTYQGAGQGVNAQDQAEDRYERMGEAFYARVSQGFESLPARFPERCVRINASQDIQAVQTEIVTAILTRLGFAL